MLDKVLNPLDQLKVDQYPTLRFPVDDAFYKSDWLENSKVTIEELKAILNALFTSSEKDKKL